MSIKYIDAVSIDGRGNSINRTLFNGYIYRLNYNVSMGQSKSTITTNLVSEDGTYDITQGDLNYSRVYPIKIGSNISVNMFLRRAKKIVEPNSKLLELEFCDTSTRLDTYIVGLYKKHGLKDQDNVIIVGKEVHPCDRDYDGKIDDLEQIEDSCHPCRNTSINNARQETVNCKEMTKYTIFDVVYNFGDLIQALARNGIRVLASDPNSKYFARHTGRVRDVLRAWCDDFGWSFYWEDEVVKIIDLRNTINVNAAIQQFCPNLSAYEEEWSVEDTFVTRSISLYERPGTNDDHECQDARYFRLPVYGSEFGSFSSELKVTDKIDPVAAGLGLYSKDLRDLYYVYDKYHLRSPNDCKPNKSLQKVGLTILTTPIKLNGQDQGGGGGLQTGTIEPSSGLNPPTGFPLNPDPSQNIAFLDSSPPTSALQSVKASIQANPYYKMCFELLSEEDQWIVANGLAKDPEDFYFFVGFYDAALDRAYYQEEVEYANEFMGRYHVYVPNPNDPNDQYFFEDRQFKLETICGQKILLPDEKVRYSPLGVMSGASVEFFNMPGSNTDGEFQTLSNLPFAKWLSLLRDSNQAASAPNRAILFKAVVVAKNGQLFSPSPSAKEEVDPNDPTEIKDNIKNQKLINEAQKGAIIRVERKNNAQGEFIPRKVTDNKLNQNLDRTKTFIFIGRNVGKDNYRMVTSNGLNTSNPLGTLYDGNPIYTRYQLDNPADQGEVYYQYPELQCFKVANETIACYRRSFKTPTCVFTYYEPTYSLFGLILEKQKTIKRKYEKLEKTFTYGPSVSDTISRIDLNYRNISDDDLNIFLNKPHNTCKYDLDKIKALSDEFARNLDVDQFSPMVSKTFTVEGVDINGTPKIADGLVGISIGLQEDGVRTTYNFATTVRKPLSEDFLRVQDRDKLFSQTYTIPVPPRLNTATF